MRSHKSVHGRTQKVSIHPRPVISSKDPLSRRAAQSLLSVVTETLSSSNSTLKPPKALFGATILSGDNRALTLLAGVYTCLEMCFGLVAFISLWGENKTIRLSASTLTIEKKKCPQRRHHSLRSYSQHSSCVSLLQADANLSALCTLVGWRSQTIVLTALKSLASNREGRTPPQKKCSKRLSNSSLFSHFCKVLV